MQNIISNNFYLIIGIASLLISKDLVLALFNHKFNKSFFEYPRLIITTFLNGLDFVLLYSVLKLIGKYSEFSRTPLSFFMMFIIAIKSLFAALLIVRIFEEK